ncbi:hypothetical protein E2562_001300 [Oryza meyeriana var. granulata]|uniref:Uncharacterized protein n=1 Tax=Oryza meyeriana var. granulata TaxID=110450 RepID=A0A6G1DD08_9ORYZ|nr:hypothetical protein E2562_001300 [Oryza meyeriana var. granulata]
MATERILAMAATRTERLALAGGRGRDEDFEWLGSGSNRATVASDRDAKTAERGRREDDDGNRGGREERMPAEGRYGAAIAARRNGEESR